jgi:hypothetical protein
MTAPRVVLLTYHIELPSGWTVPDAADAWSATLGDFDVELKGVDVSVSVLRMLGELGERQHVEHGRKVKTTAPPLTDAEVAWLNVVVPALIYRLGEVEGGATRPKQLTMNDFPALASP